MLLLCALQLDALVVQRGICHPAEDIPALCTQQVSKQDSTSSCTCAACVFLISDLLML